MDPVKISSLELSNVKRIRAVQIQPTEDGLTVIGGRNGQGKTSVLDAIAWALGGNRRKPDNPNRDGGATPAKLHVELSNGITVERRGKNGTLHVTDQTGMRGTQRLLDEFLSELALDLPKFVGGTDKDRTNALLQTLGIDQQLARLDAQIKSAFSERTAVGTEARRLRAHADEMSFHDGVPDEPVSVADLMAEQREILNHNAKVDREQSRLSEIANEQYRIYDEIERLEQQLTDIQQRVSERKSAYHEVTSTYERTLAEVNSLEYKKTDEIERRISDVEATNAKVRDNQRKAEAEQAAKEREDDYEQYTATLDRLRGERASLLDGAPLPLDGLSVDEDGRLTYMGQTWTDMSGAEQLRVATAIVRATKPDCGFVLVDKLEQFDSQTLAEFGAWAQGEGLQVIGTRVSTGDECTVVIEDGKVEGQDMSEPEPPDPKGEALSWDGEGSMF